MAMVIPEAVNSLAGLQQTAGSSFNNWIPQSGQYLCLNCLHLREIKLQRAFGGFRVMATIPHSSERMSAPA